MSLTILASKIHKWLALMIAIQVLFWFASGLFFALAPIERVRGEHTIAENRLVAVPLQVAEAGFARMRANGVRDGERIELRRLLDRPVAIVSHGKERPNLYDLATGRRISPLTRELAIAIAERDQTGDARSVRTALVDAASPEYRGALPAWRVDFEDGEWRSVYVAADTGTVTARRSTLWRVYDFLWSLHIMDFREHEDFNTPLLAIATSIGLTVVLTGLILFPSRLGYTAWRKRRKRHVSTVV